MSTKRSGLNQISIIILIFIMMLILLAGVYSAQYLTDTEVVTSSNTLSDKKTEYEISKIEAEISKIRSDISGSLFFLKLIGLFVTVGGAVGGYLLGQSRTTLAKLNFENKKNVDSVYQALVQELADKSPVLRATASVKLGAILQEFPSEWLVSETRKLQLQQLTKRVLAAALAIEEEGKVLKTLTISLVLHKPWEDDPDRKDYADVREIDLSGAKARDAYWANCDFSYADFYAADLSQTSFRNSKLVYAQFRESNLSNAVLTNTDCQKANFKMADLRHANFDHANLNGVNFECAKVFSVSHEKATFDNVVDCLVDVSEQGDGSKMIKVSKWLG